MEKDIGIEDDDLINMQTLNSLGVFYQTFGNFNYAEKYNLEALEVRQRFLGDHPSIGSMYNNIGAMYLLKGETERALLYMEKGLQIKRQFNYGHQLKETLLLSLIDISMLYCKLKRYEEALRQLHEALELNKSLNGLTSLLAASTYNNFGQVYIAMQMYPTAVDYLLKAVDIRAKYIPDHPSYMESLASLGTAYHALGKYVDALKMFDKAFKLQAQVIKQMPKWERVAEFSQHMGEAYAGVGNKEKAEKCFLEAIDQYKCIKCLHLADGNADLAKQLDGHILAVKKIRLSLGIGLIPEASHTVLRRYGTETNAAAEYLPTSVDENQCDTSRLKLGTMPTCTIVKKNFSQQQSSEDLSQTSNSLQLCDDISETFQKDQKQSTAKGRVDQQKSVLVQGKKIQIVHPMQPSMYSDPLDETELKQANTICGTHTEPQYETHQQDPMHFETFTINQHSSIEELTVGESSLREQHLPVSFSLQAQIGSENPQHLSEEEEISDETVEEKHSHVNQK